MHRMTVWVLGGLMALSLTVRIGMAVTSPQFAGSSLFAQSNALPLSPPPDSRPAPQTDIEVTLEAPASVQRTENDAVQFTALLRVANLWSSPVGNVRVIAPLPTGVTFVSANNQNCSQDGDVVSCVFSSIGSSQTMGVALTYTADAASGTCADLTIQHRAFGWSTQIDADNNNNQSVAASIIRCPASQIADLMIYKNGTASVNRGGVVTYGIYVRNNGPATAQDIVTTEIFAPGMTFLDAQSDDRCDQIDNTVVCRISSLTAGQNTTPLNIVYQLAEDFPCTPLNLTTWVKGSLSDNDSTNDTSGYQTSVECAASSSSPIVVIDPPFSPMSSSRAGMSSSSISMYTEWSMSSSRVSSSVSSRPTASAGADLELTVTTSAEVNRGQAFAHTLTVTNYGPETAKYNAVYDPMGNGFSFDPTRSDPRCAMEGGNVKCVPGDIAPGASETFVVAINTSATQTCNAMYGLNPTVFTYTKDPFPNNNRFRADTKIVCGGASAASIPSASSRPAQSSSISMYTDWSMSSRPVSSPSSSRPSSASNLYDVEIRAVTAPTAVKGEPTTLDLVVRNAGPGTAYVMVSVIAPFGSIGTLVPEQTDSRCARLEGSTATVCSLGYMNAGQETTARLGMKLQMPCDDTLNVQVHSNSLPFDTNPMNNRLLAPIKIICSSSSRSSVNPSSVSPNGQVDMMITSTIMNAKVAQGATIIHSFNVDNNGPDAAANVVVTEAIPSGFTYVDSESDPLCEQSGTSVTCPLGVIEPFSPVPVRIALRPGDTYPCGIVQNNVTVSASQQERYAGSNTVVAQTKVLCQSAARINVAVQSSEEMPSAVKGQKNVLLTRFFVLGDRDRDITFNGARFKADVGSVANAASYSLFVDMDYNGTAETGLKRGVAPSNGFVVFRDLPGDGQIVSAGRTMAMEVRADIAFSPQTDRLQLGFDTADPTYFIAQASDGSLTRTATNGSCPYTSCQINVTTGTSRTVQITNAGNLFVTKDPEPVRSKQLLGGMLGDTVLRLNFRSPNEDVDVFHVQLATWDTTGVSVDRLELYKPGEITPFATATAGGCGSESVLTVNPANGKAIKTFCANMSARELVIPTYAEMDVFVRPRLKTDVDGAISNESLTFWVPSRAGAVKARGVTSSNQLTDNDGDTLGEGEVFIGVNQPGTGVHITGNQNRSVLSKIILIYNAVTFPNPQIMAYEFQEIGRYRIGTTNHNNTKNGMNKPVITDLLFSVTSSNVGFDPSTFRIAASSNYTERKNCSVVSGGAAGETLVECRGLSFTVDPTLDVSLQVTVTSGNGSSWLKSSLTNFTNVATSFGAGADQGRIRWEDKDTSSTAFFWVDQVDASASSPTYRFIQQ